MNEVGQIWTGLGTTLKKRRSFEKIIKIYGSNDEKHYVKKLLKYVDICGRYGRKSNFAPPKKKCWNFEYTFAPPTFLVLFNFAPLYE